MRVLLILFTLLPLGTHASTTRVRVQKVKGQAALIQFVGNIQPGQEYLLIPNNQNVTVANTGPREKRIGINFVFNSLKTSSGSLETNPNELAVSVDYGWNSGHWEYGPVLGYAAENPGLGGTTTQITVGGFVDYNFSENKEPISYLFGVGAKLTYANVSNSSSSVTGLYRTTMYPQFFWKWFAWGQSTALRMDVGYYIENSKLSTATEVKSSGLQSTASLLFYY